MKKIFIISAILLLIVGIFTGIYNFVFQKKEVSQTLQEKNNPFKEKPSTTTQSIKKTSRIFPLTDEAVIAPVITLDGEKIKYYSKKDGSVYEISFSGANKKTITKNEIDGLVYVSWSPQKDKVISITNKDGKIKRYLYDYNTQSAKEYSPAMDNISWDNTGEKIFYRYTSSAGEKFLSFANPDGSNWKNLTRISYPFISLSTIPQSSLISFWNRPNGFEETSFHVINSMGGEPKTLLTQRFGADYLWSPSGNKVLVSSTDSRGGSKTMLAVMNPNGGEYKNLNIPTMVSKCVWSKDENFVYFSLPGSIPEGSVMPNDYNEGKFNTRDSFWKVDINTGKQERIVELSDIKENYDAKNLFLSPLEDYLFFVNRLDDKLYGIELQG